MVGKSQIIQIVFKQFLFEKSITQDRTYIISKILKIAILDNVIAFFGGSYFILYDEN